MARSREWTPEQKEAARQRARAMNERRKAAAAAPADAEVEQHLAPALEPAPEPDAVELTDEEREQIRAEAAKVIDEELAKRRRAERKALLSKSLKDEIEKQRYAAGLVDSGDEIVEWMVNVAPFSPGITLDGHVYPHGHWMKTTRRVYDSCRDIMARSWESEDRAGNPNKKFMEWRQAAGVTNPMFSETRLADGTFTVGLAMGNVNGTTGHVVRGS